MARLWRVSRRARAVASTASLTKPVSRVDNRDDAPTLRPTPTRGPRRVLHRCAPFYLTAARSKIAFNLDGVKAGIKTLDRKKNYNVTQAHRLCRYYQLTKKSRTWNFGGGNPDAALNEDTVTHRYNSHRRLYRVRLIKCDPRYSCNGCDTAFTQSALSGRKTSASVDLVITAFRPAKRLRLPVHQ